MDDYISREATVKAFCEKCRGYYDGHCIHKGECDIDVIQTAPAADVQPVKHGRWIDNGICDSMLSACSICGYSCGAYSFNYCPNCGARMDGDSDGQ
jgi:hypothetical protein